MNWNFRRKKKLIVRVIKRRAAFECIKNRKTVQKNNRKPRKTEINFNQNQKPQAKSEKSCTRLRSLRPILYKEKPKQHQTASPNSKSENPILILPKSEIEQKSQTTTDIKTKKPKIFGTKTDQAICDLKWPKPQNRKSSIPPSKTADASSPNLEKRGPIYQNCKNLLTALHAVIS